jgi:hypothetical protein
VLTATRPLTSSASQSDDRAARMAHMNNGPIDFVVVVRFFRELNRAKQYRTIKVSSTNLDAAADVAQRAIMQLGPSCIVSFIYPATAIGC